MSDHADLGGEAPCWAHLADELEPHASQPGPVVVDVAGLADDGADGAIWSLPHGGELDANVVRLGDGNAIADHVNGEVDVLLVVWSGAGELVVDDHATALRSGIVVAVPRGSRRAVRAQGSDLTYLSIHRRRDGLMIRT
jgi:mannose-6-phosphate isomerase-like protein (cupin superfamily)